MTSWPHSTGSLWIQQIKQIILRVTYSAIFEMSPHKDREKLLTKWELDKLIVSTFSVLFSGLLPDLALLSDHSIQVHSK